MEMIKMAIRIIGFQSNDIGKSCTVFSPYESAKQYWKAMSSLESFSVPFFVDWTPVLECPQLRAYWRPTSQW